MNNPLANGIPQVPQMGNIQEVMRQYNQFKQSFHGNPQEQIQQMLNSGRVSQSAYNAAYQKAQMFQRMMGGK